MIPGVIHSKNQTALSEAVFNYYNFRKEDRNLIQSKHDGLVHHHYGITGTQISNDASQEEITQEIQRQETEQSKHLINLLISNKTEAINIYDVGCGRFGTSFIALEECPLSNVTGINITEYQTKFCQEEILKKNLNLRATVHQGDFLNSPFQDNSFTHAIVNEVTPYVLDLNKFFKEMYRVMSPKGRIVIATWGFNDNKDTSDFWKFIAPISDHYGSFMHGINEYKTAAKEFFDLIEEQEKTNEIIEYWELRLKWHLQSSVDPYFLNAHKNGDMKYMFFVLEKK